jgi:hypothetical protein
MVFRFLIILGSMVWAFIGALVALGSLVGCVVGAIVRRRAGSSQGTGDGAPL